MESLILTNPGTIRAGTLYERSITQELKLKSILFLFITILLILFAALQINDKIESLKKSYEEKVTEKEDLGRKAKLLQLKLERAGKIVSGLGGEKDRWESSVEVTKCLVSFEFKVYTDVTGPQDWISTYFPGFLPMLVMNLAKIA